MRNVRHFSGRGLSQFYNVENILIIGNIERNIEESAMKGDMLINQAANSSQLSTDKIIEAKGPNENSINIRNVFIIKQFLLYFCFVFTEMKQQEMTKNMLLLKPFLI